MKWFLNGVAACAKSLSLTPFGGPKTPELSDRALGSSSFERGSQVETGQMVYLEGREINK
jgi:hypothetical protein